MMITSKRMNAEHIAVTAIPLSLNVLSTNSM